MALATTMLVTSFNVVYAQDADVTTGETTVESSETSLTEKMLLLLLAKMANMVLLMAKLGQQLLHGKLQFSVV